MDPQSSQLQHRQAEETTQNTSAQQHLAGEQAAREFGSVEDMLRHDARQNPPPPRLEERVAESAANLAPPARSWWRKLLSGEP
jgi:hypothetical protein